MKKIISPFASCLALVGGLILIGSCNKKDPYDLITPPAAAHFVGPQIQLYQMLVNPPPAYNLVVGTTDVSGEARVVTYNVTSTTAIAGTHYTITSGPTVTIPAGQATANIVIQGVQTFYTTGRKDTLVFTLKEPGVKVAPFMDTVRVVLRGPCFDSEVTFPPLLGTYTRTFENGTYGPYTSTIISHTQLTPTTSRATLTNIYDLSISAVGTFDYSIVGGFTATFLPQATQYTVGGLPLFVRSTPATTSTFTYCTPFFTLYFDLYTTAGLYDRWVTTLAR